MADEIAQVVQLEIQGLTMVVKGTVQAAAYILRALKAMFNGGVSLNQKHKDYLLNRKGNKSFPDLTKLCGDTPPQVIKIRAEDLDEVMRIAEKNELHFCFAQDFDPTDGMVPIFITPKEAPMWGQICKASVSQRLDEDRKTVSEYDRLIAEEKEKLESVKEPKEIVKIQTKIENLEQAKEESAKWVDYGEDVLSKDDISISFQEYLKEAKGTDFEKNPEMAMAEYEKGVELGRSFGAKEIFQPVRDKSLMPESKVMFYVPESGAIVTREFQKDEQSNLVYCRYSLKTKEGEIYTCTDKDMTKEKWNESVLPKLLDKADILEGTECRVFDSEEKLKSFLTYHNKLESPAQKNVEKALEEHNEVFSNAEAKNEVLNFLSEKSKGIASANVTGAEVEIVCNPRLLTKEHGQLQLKLSDDESILFSKVANEGLAPNGMVKFTISDESKSTFVKKNDKALTAIGISPVEAQNKIGETLGQGVANTVLKSTQHKGR